MIYLLYGPDIYRSQQKLKAIKAKYLNTSKGDVDLLELDGSNLTASQFNIQFQTRPLLSGQRLIIINDLLMHGSSELCKLVAQKIPEINTNILIFYERGLPDRRSVLFKALDKPKQAQFFDNLTGHALIHEIGEIMHRLNFSISTEAITYLVTITGSDLFRIENELQKIALYKSVSHENNNQQNVLPKLTDIELINLLVSGLPEAKVFDLTDAFGLRQGKKGQEIINRLSGEGSDAVFGLMAMLASHIRNLILVADGQSRGQSKPSLLAALKIHPYAFDKAYIQARNFQLSELLVAYNWLLNVDFAAKSSLFEPILGMRILLQELASTPLKLPELTEEKVLYLV